MQPEHWKQYHFACHVPAFSNFKSSRNNFCLVTFASSRSEPLPDSNMMIDQKQLISDDALDQHSDLNHTSSSPSSSSSSSVDHVKTESNFGRSAVKLFSLGARHRASANLSDTKVGEAEPNAINVVAVLNPSEQLQLNTFNGTHQQHSQADGIACGKDGKAAANRGQSFSSDWQSHCHKPTMAGSNNEQDAKQRSANRRLLITTMLCAFFMVVELVGGYLANSLSIMTDAAHLFSDIASFALSLLAVHLSSRRSNRKFTFGYQRAEILGAVCSILLIWMLTAVVVWLAIQRLLTMDFEIESTVMMAVSLFGVAVNILMGVTLHGCMCAGKPETGDDAELGKVSHSDDGKSNDHSDCSSNSKTVQHKSHSHSHHGHSHGSHSHSHGHSHHGHSHGVMEGESINIRAAFIHVIGDLIQSVGVFVAAVLIYFRPDWKVADPICTFLFSFLVLFTTVRLMKESLLVLMEAAPPHLDYMTIKLDLLGLPGVQMVHSLRLWQLSTDHAQLICHLVVNEPTVNGERLLHMARQLLQNKHGIKESTMQLESYEPQVMLVCETCNHV